MLAGPSRFGGDENRRRPDGRRDGVGGAVSRGDVPLVFTTFVPARRERRVGDVLQRDVLRVLRAAGDGVRRDRPDVGFGGEEQEHQRERGGDGTDHVVARVLAQRRHLHRGVLRDRQPAQQPDPGGDAFLPAVLRAVQAEQRRDSASRNDCRAAMGGEQRGARHRRRVRPGSDGASHGARLDVSRRARRDVRPSAVAGPHFDPRRVEVRGVRQGRAGDVSYARPVRDIPAVHVQLAAIAVFADREQHPRRDGFLSPRDGPRDGSELARDDPADFNGVHVRRTA